MIPLLLALAATAAPPAPSAETARAEAQAASDPADAERWLAVADALDALQRTPVAPPTLAVWWDALTAPALHDRAFVAALAGADPPPDPWRPLTFPPDHPGDAALQRFASLAASPVRCQQDGEDELLLGSTDDVDFIALLLGGRFYTPRTVRRLVEVVSYTGLPDAVAIARRGRAWPTPYAHGVAGAVEAAAALADADARGWALALGAALGLDEAQGRAAVLLYPPPGPPSQAAYCQPLP